MYAVSSVIAVATAGTPVALTSDKNLTVNSFLVKQLYGNAAGVGYVGLSAMVKATGVNVIYDLTTVPASFASPGSMPGQNVHKLADYYVDADVSGMKFLVTYWVF